MNDEDKLLNIDEIVNTVLSEEDFDVHSEQGGKKVIDHVKVANAAVKFIQVAPIHSTIKKIMTLRISSPFKNGRHMSHMQVAIQLGLLEREVVALEQEGIYLVNEFMKRVCVTDGIGEFNADRRAQNNTRSTLGDEQT